MYLRIRKRCGLTYHGIETSLEMALDYSAFENITYEEALQIKDFCTDFPYWLKAEESGYVKYSVSNLTDDCDVEDLYGIIKMWQMEETAIKRDCQNFNDDIIESFRKIRDEAIDCEKFEKFLDELTVETSAKGVTVSSKYSDYELSCEKFDSLCDVVCAYIKEIDKRGDIIIYGFTTEDDDIVFRCTISEKFNTEEE